jgi:hypothetical protein
MSMKKLLLFALLLMAMLLAACSAPEAGEPAVGTEATATPAVLPTTEAAEPTAAPPTPEAEAATCPEATEDTYLLRNPQHGYCLLYPATHKIERPNPEEVNIVVGSLLNTIEPRVNIKVVSSDQSAEAFADEIVAGFEGFEIARPEATVAGEPAVVLDNVPGQDINRQIIFTHGDALYHLYFTPVNPDAPEALDTFAQGILDSFTFIPVTEIVTAADECVAPKADEQQVLSEAFGFCFLAPADFTYEQPSETNANVFFGSMMDVEHPKLMIEVLDAGGKTAVQAADELVASFEGFEIPRTFGDTLGYEPAERLDGVPGQDLGRVLLVTHNDRLYRLTFVPADPTQTGVYEQMEALFAQVLNTFRFLP